MTSIPKELRESPDLVGHKATPRKRFSNLFFPPTLQRIFRETALLKAAAGTVALAVLFAAFTWWWIGFPLIGYWTWGIGAGETTRADATRIVLTMIAGVGGIVALVIAYRKQLGAEEGRFMASLENAARQLGASEPTVQFAGIYALASLADDSPTARKQQCVDVLCGYLRLPYAGTGETSLVREVVRKRTWFDSVGGVEETLVQQLRPSDKEVRLTIIREIAERLQVAAPNSWSALKLDFTAAVLDGGDFSGAVFDAEDVSFREVKFNGGTIDFNRAKFRGRTASFAGAEFNGGTIDFSGIEWTGVYMGFEGAKFNGGTVDFDQATFDGTMEFDGEDLHGGSASFESAEFNGGRVSFFFSIFKPGSQVDFCRAAFNGSVVEFNATDFEGGSVDFSAPVSWEVPPEGPWDEGLTPPGVRLPR